MNTETQEIVKQDNSLMARLGPVELGARGVKLATMDDVFRFAKAVSMSQLCPAGFSETDCFVIIQNGLEVGMSPMAALANTYIVNNRATIFGDMPLALVRQSELLEDYEQEYIGKQYDDDFCCKVSTKRRGQSKPSVTTYSVMDAKEANLWDKVVSRNGKDFSTPWVTAKKRMLLFRARGFNLRDNFGDVLKGCSIAELNDDYEGDLNKAGIAHARPITGKVVEPIFKDRQQPPAGLMPVVNPERVEQLLNEHAADKQAAEPFKRGPGRPRKAEPQPAGAGATSPPAAPPAEPETKPAAPPQPPLQPPPAPPWAPVTPDPVNESDVHAEVRKKLHNENIREDRFLILMLGFGFANCDRDDIVTGKFKLENMLEDDLVIALKNWDQVVNIDDV
jgi:hypothetical protein